MNAKHVGRVVSPVSDRAIASQERDASPSHVTLPTRLNMRPMVRESALRARFVSLFRLLSLRPRHGNHGVAYLRGSR